MRGCFYFIDHGNLKPYVEQIFEAYWTNGENISEDEFLERLVEKMEVNPKEFDNTQNLIDRGGFGSPTFFLDVDDMYFGNDRLQLIEKII